MNYQLRDGLTDINSAVPGTGGTITLPTGNLTSTTTFNVLATNVATTCTAQLTDLVTITITDGIPVTPDPISGDADQCPSFGGQVYSIAPVADATNYTWNVPAGWTITAGDGTTSITVTTGTEGQDGDISVTAGNAYGTSSASVFAVVVHALPVTSLISGDTIVCQNEVDIIYQVDMHAGSQYTWSIPAHISKTFDEDLYLIHIDAAAPGTGDIEVYETSIVAGCVSSSQSISITVFPVALSETPLGPANLCMEEVGVSYSIPLNAGSTYEWTLPSGAFITGDQNANQVEVSFPIAGSGQVKAVETYNGCITEHIPLAVSIDSLPSPTLTGPVIIPRINSINNRYYTETGMSDYSWSISAGGSISSGGTLFDDSVTVSWNSTGDQFVSINYTDPGTSCEASAPTVVNYTISPLPTANNVSITGSLSIGTTLSGSYTYVDGGEGSEGTSLYRWLRNDTVLVGTELTYTTVVEDHNSTLTFEVTPVSDTGNPNTGIPVKSQPTTGIEDLSEIPVAKEVCIDGVRDVGNVLQGKYRYTHSRPEGNSIYQWYRGSVPIPSANSIDYTLTTEDIDANEDITFEVTPVSSNTVPNTGTPVQSNPHARITLAEDEFSVAIETVALTASPSGGVFSGPYISDDVFSPMLAGVGGPYTGTYFLYEINDFTSCSQEASFPLTVLPDTTYFNGFDSVYCKNGENDIISVTDLPPGASSLGFELSEAGAIVSMTDWTITIDPTQMKVGNKLDTLRFRYTYDGYDYVLSQTFIIDTVGTNLQFVNLDDAYCSDALVKDILVSGVYPVGGRGDWTGSILSTLSETSSSLDVSLGLAGDSYPITYQYTSPLGCKSPLLSRGVSILSSPAAETITSSGSLDLCLGDSVILSVTDSSDYNYEWKREGSPVGLDLYSYVARTSGSYSLTITNSSGCSSDASNTIDIPDVNYELTTSFQLSGPTSFCQGGSLEMSVTENTDFTYQWQKNGEDIPGATTNIYTTENSGIFSLNVVNASACGSKTEDVTVSVYNLPVPPVITAQGSVELCEGDSVTLRTTYSSDYSYQWKNDGNPVGRNLDSLVTSSPGSYSLTVSNAGGCKVNSANTLTVVINSLAESPQLSINGATTFCKGGSVDLSVSNNPDYTYQWQQDGLNIPGASSNMYTAETEGEYSLNIRNSSGCLSSTDSVQVNVSEAPTAPFISPLGPLELCLGDSCILSVTNNETYAYSWKQNGQPLSSDSSTLIAKSSGLYSLSVMNSAGCSVNSANTIQLSDANFQLTSTLMLSGPTSFCQGSNLEMTVTNNPDYTFQWQKDGSNIIGETTNSFVAESTGTYSLDVLNSTGCRNKTVDVNVTVIDAPVSPLILADGLTEFCQGDSCLLSVTLVEGLTYQWRLNGGGYGDNANELIVKSSGTYNLDVSNDNDCSKTSINSISIIVNANPVAPGIGLSGPTTFCDGDSVTLSVQYSPELNYSWRDENGELSGEDASSFTANTSGIYLLYLSNSDDCFAQTSEVNVTVKTMPQKPIINSDNYSYGMCLGEKPLLLHSSTSISEYKYQWNLNRAPLANENKWFIEGFLEEGEYSLEADLNGCKSSSDILDLSFAEALDKPSIIAEGPTIWYLACDNTTAAKYKWYYEGEIISGANDYIYVARQNLGQYQVSVADTNDCFTISDTITIPLVTGMDFDNPLELLQIYPNPTNSYFTLTMDNQLIGSLHIDLLSIDGKVIYNDKIKKTDLNFSTQIDLGGHPPGDYLIKVTIDSYTSVRKIVLY